MGQVYPPSEDSFLLEKCILKFDLNGKSCLDLGCGSGILSIAMLRAGAREVVALDVDRDAVIETRKNVEAFIKENKSQYVGRFLGVFESDLFSALEESNGKINFQKIKGIGAKFSDLGFVGLKKFDFISFNPPYVPTGEIKWVDLDGGMDGCETIIRFISTVKNYLNDDGIVFLLISSLNKRNKIIKLIKKQGLRVSVLERLKFFFEELIVLRISH